MSCNQPRSSSLSEPHPKVLAISSGGGHWVQLMRLRPAFEGCEVSYATVSRGYQADLDADAVLYVVPDADRRNKIGLVCSTLAILRLMLRLRPDVVVTTGAAPGYLGVRIGKLLGARVIWVDSIANAEELSLSGKKAGSFADLWLTQWPHLACQDGPHCFGNVL